MVIGDKRTGMRIARRPHKGTQLAGAKPAESGNPVQCSYRLEFLTRKGEIVGGHESLSRNISPLTPDLIFRPATMRATDGGASVVNACARLYEGSWRRSAGTSVARRDLAMGVLVVFAGSGSMFLSREVGSRGSTLFNT